MRPLIGITGRRLPSTALSAIEERYQHTAIDMYFSDFAKWIHAAGGIPVELPYEAGDKDTVARLDGLLITGGQDVTPSLWNGPTEAVKGDTDIHRDHYEMALASYAIADGVPVLGICRGAQVINVARGGTLVPDLPTTPIDHVSSGLPVETRQHDVTFEEGSLASRLYGETSKVNSLHHQSVHQCGEGILVTGRAGDGTVEAFEIPGHLVLGVQWHPEWLGVLDPSIQWLVNVAADRAVGCHEPR